MNSRSFTVKLVAIDDWGKPSDNLKTYDYTLCADKPGALYVPNGYANGFKAMEGDSKLMVMSNLPLMK